MFTFSFRIAATVEDDVPLEELVGLNEQTAATVDDNDSSEELEAMNKTQQDAMSDKPFLRSRNALFVLLGLISSLLLVGPIDRALLPVFTVCSFLFFLGRIATFTLFPRMSNARDLRASRPGTAIDGDLLEKMSLPCFASLTLVLALAVPGPFTPSITMFGSAAAEVAWWLVLISLVRKEINLSSGSVSLIRFRVPTAFRRWRRLWRPLRQVLT